MKSPRVAALVALAGCSGLPTGRTCTLELRSTIAVSVLDARTGAPISAGSTIIVRGGAVYDSIVVVTPQFGANVGYMGWEDKVKAGRYTVEVRRPGYVDWVRNDVEVTGDDCHSGPGPALTAALQPRA
ncbi:hypothetical protein BH11GEM1_BH11GEM1_04560 [soil metagenome]